MKRIMSVLISAAIILSMSTFSVLPTLAAEITDDTSVQTEAYAENVGVGVYSENTEATENIPIDDFPKVTSFTPTVNGVKISWTQYSGAAKYRIYLFNGSGWRSIGESKTLSFLHSPLKNSTTYLYTVRALGNNNNFVSSYSKQGFENTFYAPPVISSVTNVFDGVSVRWEKLDGVEKYRVYRRTDNTSWKRIGDCDGNSYVDNTALSGTKYTYTLRCLDPDDRLISSFNAGKSVKYIEAPQITKLENTVSGTKITWTKSQGASKYRVFYLDSNNVWRTIGTTSATSYTHKNLIAGTTNKYTVRCLDSKGRFISAYDKVGVSNTFVAPPVISSVTNVFDGVSISWEKFDGVEKYRVYRKTDSTSWKRVGDCEGNSYIDKTALSGTKYTYTLRCLDSDNKLISSFNAGKSVKYIEAPQITKLENTATGTKITWTKSQGASKYRVFYLDSNNVWRTIGTTSATSYTHNNLITGTTNKYTVRCLDSKGKFISAYDKTGKENLFIAPPEISEISNQNGRNLIQWELVDGVKSYRLYRKTVGSSWSRVADINGTWYLDSDIKAGYVYTYTLRCLDSDGNLISYYVSNTKYYVDGELANGEVTQDGKTYTFSNGLFRSGYQTIDGAKYYYNSSGILEKNGIVGSDKDGWSYADENGVCCTSEEICLAAEYMMKYCKGNTLDEKMKSGFLYMAKNFPYNRTYDHPKRAADIAPLAIDMFKNRRGNCFRYAACFACVAKIAGYRTRVVVGTTYGNPHGWTEVLVDGKWLICDPDAQLPGYHVPDYKPYMMKNHYWQLTVHSKYELTIKDGKAVWK